MKHYYSYIMTLTYWQWETSILNSQQQTVIQTKIKQRHVGVNWCHEPNGPTDIYRTFFSPKYKRLYLFLCPNPLEHSPKLAMHLDTEQVPKDRRKLMQNQVFYETTTDLKLDINNNRNNKKFTNSWQLNSLLNKK